MNNLIPNMDIHKLEVSKLKTDSDETCCTFLLHNEDHTLGNPLRYIILKDPDVEVCGYNVPHPSEHRINLRIQTRTLGASDVLKCALCEIQNVCDHILETFKESLQQYKNTRGDVEEDEEDEEEEEDDDEMDDDEEM